MFLDRDGTLIEDAGYLGDPNGVRLFPDVRAALARLLATGCRLFLFTNQSGIGRGLYTLQEAEAVNLRMEALLDLIPSDNENNTWPFRSLFDGVCMAPELPHEPSLYRKPSPRYIRERIDEYNLNPAVCWMVGDRRSDIDAGLAAGINAALVRADEVNDPGLIAYAAARDVAAYADLGYFAEKIARHL